MPDLIEVGLTADFQSEGKLLYKDIGLGILEEAGIGYHFLEQHEPRLSPAVLERIDGLICLAPRITRESLANSVRLIAVARFGVGYDAVDVNACTEADVALFIAKGAVDYSVAEAILAWMLALGHRMVKKDQITRQGRWNEKTRWMGSELRRKVVGVIGLGGIGRQLVRLLQPFEVAKMLAYDPYVQLSTLNVGMVTLVPLPELLRSSDYLVVCCPLTDETRGLLGPGELALMKATAYLVNTARGGIVDEQALASQLRSRGVAGAAIDVFAQEPLLEHHPFFDLENVLLAPHAIAWTDELFEAIGTMCCRQLVALFRGELPDGLVNAEVWNRPGFQAKLTRLRAR
jgi:phosphoglycerate dehydrogenase-like enzyme